MWTPRMRVNNRTGTCHPANTSLRELTGIMLIYAACQGCVKRGLQFISRSSRQQAAAGHAAGHDQGTSPQSQAGDEAAPTQAASLFDNSHEEGVRFAGYCFRDGIGYRINQAWSSSTIHSQGHTATGSQQGAGPMDPWTQIESSLGTALAVYTAPRDAHLLMAYAMPQALSCRTPYVLAEGRAIMGRLGTYRLSVANSHVILAVVNLDSPSPALPLATFNCFFPGPFPHPKPQGTLMLTYNAKQQFMTAAATFPLTIQHQPHVAAVYRSFNCPLIVAQRPGPMVVSSMQQLRHAAPSEEAGMSLQPGVSTSRPRTSSEQAWMAFMVEAFSEFVAHSNSLELVSALLGMTSNGPIAALVTAAQLAKMPLPQGRPSSRAFQHAKQMALLAQGVAGGILQLYVDAALQQDEHQKKVKELQDTVELLRSQVHGTEQAFEFALGSMALVNEQFHMDPWAAAGVAQQISATVLPFTAPQGCMEALGLAQQLAQNVADLRMREQAYALQWAMGASGSEAAVAPHSLTITQRDSTSLQHMLQPDSDEMALLGMNGLQDTASFVNIELAQQQVETLVDTPPQQQPRLTRSLSHPALTNTADIGGPAWHSSNNPHPLLPAASTVLLTADTQQGTQQGTQQQASMEAAVSDTYDAPAASTAAALLPHSSIVPQAAHASAAHTRRIRINKLKRGCYRVMGLLLDAAWTVRSHM